ncbi:hypothetical protein DBR12_12935 [Acidovorax sp. HMWF029]|uniref:hypothetical protein n=1 Tax=Acidovorax sp. HMWF029 TaxID=2056863 RepID=UPI000D3ACF5B|nr:hypothetical protein [Acidovorax sp. HMWF029]PTT19188.1 hypothetical protein DBR12_12935 [Acidovorax sp. HMWF029]
MTSPYLRIPSIATVLAAAVLLSGCGTLDVPRADNYPATGQKKARAVHHWDVLAGDVAARVADKIATWPQGEYPIHVTVADNSRFNLGFLKLLKVHLLNRGVAVSTVPTAVELEVQTQLVQHESAVSRSLPVPIGGTLLGTGVGVWRDWKVHYADRTLLPGVATALGVGAGVALDMAQLYTQGAAAGGPTRTEVLITTTLKSQDRYLAGSADMYYIEQADAVLYLPELPPVAPVPTPVKTWRVVAP